MKNKVYTLGYEKKSINEFIEILQRAKIKILIDVRETAWSYKRDFCKTKFNEALERNGITYVHIRKAGNPKKIRRNSTSIQGCLNVYRKYLYKTKAGIEDLENILVAANLEGEAVCLTCYEKDHVNCHRSIITDCLKDTHSTLNICHL
jgi:uncharacterized protein (DUF488 family)